jgi:L-lactate dehydrogenase
MADLVQEASPGGAVRSGYRALRLWCDVKRRVAIIGTGLVGSSVAVSTLHSGVADELLLHDARQDVAEGEAMDLAHGASFCPPATVRATTIDELLDADAIVVSAGRGDPPRNNRLELLTQNASVIKTIGKQLRGARGVLVMVSNPVDILTHVMAEASGLPAERVIGTGTMLDTARLRHVIGRTIEVDPHSIHADVVGEHGDSEVALWSTARVGVVPLRQWPGWDDQRERLLSETVRRAGFEILHRKGATNHAIGMATADLLQCILRDERRVLTVSRVLHGALGLRAVAMSLPTVVGAQGAIHVVEPDMSNDERRQLEESAGVLRAAFARVAA